MTPRGIQITVTAIYVETFNEANQIRTCRNSEARGGTPVDMLILLTEECASPPRWAGLARFRYSATGTANPVSYHYTVGNSVNLSTSPTPTRPRGRCFPWFV